MQHIMSIQEILIQKIDPMREKTSKTLLIKKHVVKSSDLCS